MENTEKVAIPKRSVRSYVLRQSHMTRSQQQAIDCLMDQWGIEYLEQHIDINKFFPHPAPLILEIGFGMGQATAEIAATMPEYNFLAIDVHGPGVGNLLKLIEEKTLTNLRLMRHDAVEVLTQMINDQTFAGVHIFFPDPWPKTRHHKRRLIQTKFLDLLATKVKPGGYLHLATDWQDYAEHMLETLSAHTQWHNQYEGYAPKPKYRPETKFEARGKRLGHGVWDLVFVTKS